MCVIYNFQNISNRKQSKTDFCFFCEISVTKFHRHLFRHHKFEVEVQKIMSLPIKSQERRNAINKIRNSGNFIKSLQEDTVVPVRKSKISNPTTSSILPCKFCKGFYDKKYLY